MSSADTAEETPVATVEGTGRRQWIGSRLIRPAIAIMAVFGLLVWTSGDQIALLLGDQRSVLLQAAVTGLLLGGVYALVAMGLTLIFGVMGVINFAHGALLTVGMYTGYALVTATGLDPYVTILGAVPVLFVIGYSIQRVVMQRVMAKPHETQLLVTLGLSLIIANGLLFIFGANPKSTPSALSADMSIFGAEAPLLRVLAFVAGLLIAGGLHVMLRRTKTGNAIRAVASNQTGAALVGIDSRHIFALTFGIGAACVGAAGVLVLPFLTLEPHTGDQFNIIAFVVVVLGGLGSVPGAVTGGLLVGLVYEIGGVVMPDQSKLLGVLIVFVVVLVVRPQGLFGKPA